MLYTSDIPDWVACEGLGLYDYDYKIGGAKVPEILCKLFERSPIRFVDNVKKILKISKNSNIKM